MHLSFPNCWKSLFRCHNETINIWSHLIGLFYFIYLMFQSVFFSDLHSGISTKLVLVVFLISAQVCFLGSSVYHLFNCHSEEVLMKVTRFDYSGISLLISGSFFPPIFFAFYCHPFWQILYLGTISVLGIAGITCGLFEFYHRPSFNSIRILSVVGTAASGVVPIIHAYSQKLDNMNLLSDSSITTNLFYMYLLYSIGLLFYVTKMPESIWKGKFDIYFNSHQLWHLFVLLATLVHFQNCIQIFEFWTKSNQCPVL